MLRQLTTFCSIALVSSSLAFGAQAGSTAPTKPAAPTAAPSAQGVQKSTTSKSIAKKHRKHHKKASTPKGAAATPAPAAK